MKTIVNKRGRIYLYAETAGEKKALEVAHFELASEFACRYDDKEAAFLFDVKPKEDVQVKKTGPNAHVGRSFKRDEERPSSSHNQE